MQLFKAKVSYAILIPTILTIVGCFALPAWHGAPSSALWIMAAVLTPTLALILNVFFGTHYLIQDSRLKIKCGWFYNWDIEIEKIVSINKTRNPISSPAPSLDRLEIHYGGFDSVIVSPKDKGAFIAALRAVNPEIKHYG